MTKTNSTLADKRTQIIEFTQKIKAKNTIQSTWSKRIFQGVNSIHYEEYFPKLIVFNSKVNDGNEPIFATIFDSHETIILGMFVIPNQLDSSTTLEQFIKNLESAREHFDALLLIENNVSFCDFGFTKITNNDKNQSITHYRNNSIDFECFKNIFKSKSIVFMRTILYSGSDKAMDSIRAVFAIPNFYKNKIATINHSMVSVTTGANFYTTDDINQIGRYSLSQIKRGATFCFDMFEDKLLENNTKTSVMISCFDLLH